MRSRLFQRCPTLRTFQEGDVSNLAADAGPINGTYCRGEARRWPARRSTRTTELV